MTMQIRELLLYNRRGDIRRLSFRLGAMNVITGGSGTGKSALITSWNTAWPRRGVRSRPG